MLQLHFKPETKGGFYDVLRSRAAQYLEASGDINNRNWFVLFKAIFFLSLFVFGYIQILTGSEYLFFWYALLGFLTVPLILNIGHESVHGSFMKGASSNRRIAYLFNILGADGDIWRKRHVHSHHVLPNIPGGDSDISQNQLARIAPNAAWLPIHRYQHWYMPFLYLIYTLNWLIYRDFKDVRILFRDDPTYWRRVIVLIISKIFYFGYILVIPMLLLETRRAEVLTAFIVMQFVMSATTFLVLVSAHVGEHAVFPEPDSNGYISHSWSEHQLITTTDFAPDNFLITHLFGGFNHHAVHHLFPTVSHIHYPALTQILKETAAEYKLPYQCFPTLRSSVISHFRFLKKNSLPNDLFEHADF